jgi:iron complex transport system permease protein
MNYRVSSTPTYSPAANRAVFGLGGRRVYVPLLAAVALCAAIIISVGVGPVYIGPGRVVEALLGNATGTSGIIVNEVRLPRVLVGAMVGAMLATSGAILQGVTRNPLADPHIFGISGGAGLVAVAGIVFFPNLPQGVLQPLAFVGGIIGGGIAYTMAWRGGVTPVRLALAGIAVTSMLTAVISAILVTSAFSAQIGLRWLIGGLLGRNWNDFELLWPYFLAGMVPTLILSRQLNILTLGDEVATSLGQHVERTRLLFVALAALLASAAVSIAGLIGFIGLIIPHLVRLILGNDYRFLIPTSALFGAVLLVFSDTAARMIFEPHELPVGVLTAIMGGPVFIMLVRRKA